MPEMTFVVRWPDGTLDRCYSPSLVMHDHLEVGAIYEVNDFLARSTIALDIASQRVKERFGIECTSASEQKLSIERVAGRFREGTTVQVLEMYPPLPQ